VFRTTKGCANVHVLLFVWFHVVLCSLHSVMLSGFQVCTAKMAQKAEDMDIGLFFLLSPYLFSGFELRQRVLVFRR